jgi:hypothetical protein
MKRLVGFATCGLLVYSAAAQEQQPLPLLFCY